MNKQERWVGVACVDWDNAALVASAFYPEEVPADWYLTYYANYITACVISPAKWMNALPEEVMEWVEQTQDNFWFYVWCDNAEQLASARLRVADFGGKFAGFVLPESFSDEQTASIPHVLVIGKQVYDYRHRQLREAKAPLLQWLTDGQTYEHSLVLLSEHSAHEVHNVQTLLALLGVNQ